MQTAALVHEQVLDPVHQVASTAGCPAQHVCTVCCSMQVPSNFILSRVGAKRWLSFVIIAWGCIAVASAALQNSAQFMALRVLLGAAEAGTFPGMRHGKRLSQIMAHHCAWWPVRTHQTPGNSVLHMQLV